MATLPTELIESIIDLTSPSSLAACALVCRQWTPRSRHHHFRSISLARDRSTDTVRTFLHLLASPLVTFVSSIREVRLYFRSSYGTPVLSAGDIILLLARYKVHPTSLDVDCQFNQLYMTGAQQASFASLTHLRLSLFNAVPLEKLFDYLCIFPSLQSLSLHIRDFKSELLSDRRLNRRVLPPDLHEMILAQPRILIGLLSLEPVPSQFSTLTLGSLDQWDEVNQYLAHSTISATLESLTLTECFTGATSLLSGLSSLTGPQERGGLI
jgi:hypothetical protein